MGAEQLTNVKRYLQKTIRYSELSRYDWKRQTDVIQECFEVAALLAEYGDRVIFIDGHINDRVKVQALASPQGIKGFFNRRFHDTGFKNRRIIFFDTLTTRAMGERGSGRHKLHFHGMFVLDAGQSIASLKRVLGKIFGIVQTMGQRQFHSSSPDWDKHQTHNGAQAFGALGKALYAIAHAGTTYRNLDLNDGKRSRKAPRFRASCNLGAQNLARGIPSNFNRETVFCDSASKRAGKEAFVAWIKSEKILSKADGKVQAPAGSPGPQPKKADAP